MSENLLDELKARSLNEPYGSLLGMEVVTVANGSALVSMKVRPELENIFGSTHGGALFSLIDEAFQLACNSHGVLSVALNVSITYVAAPAQGCTLEAEAREVHRTNRTASYQCRVSEQGGKLIATAQALAYRTGKDVKLKPH
jgi:acyl-CoA thioesterase